MDDRVMDGTGTSTLLVTCTDGEGRREERRKERKRGGGEGGG